MGPENAIQTVDEDDLVVVTNKTAKPTRKKKLRMVIMTAQTGTGLPEVMVMMAYMTALKIVDCVVHCVGETDQRPDGCGADGPDDDGFMPTVPGSQRKEGAWKVYKHKHSVWIGKKIRVDRTLLIHFHQGYIT
jgi:hypothetical protein